MTEKRVDSQFWLSVLTERYWREYTTEGRKQSICSLFQEEGAATTMAQTKAAPRAGKDNHRLPTMSSSALETLNFKVTAGFKRQFKGYAVSQGISMVELLKEGFALSQDKRKQAS